MKYPTMMKKGRVPYEEDNGSGIFDEIIEAQNEGETNETESLSAEITGDGTISFSTRLLKDRLF